MDPLPRVRQKNSESDMDALLYYPASTIRVTGLRRSVSARSAVFQLTVRRNKAKRRQRTEKAHD